MHLEDERVYCVYDKDAQFIFDFFPFVISIQCVGKILFQRFLFGAIIGYGTL